MQLSRIEINNYRNLSGVNIDFSDDINIIVGENNIGKSNLLYCILSLLTGKKFEEMDFFDKEKPIIIDFSMHLDDEELGVFDDFFDAQDHHSINIVATQSTPDDYITYKSINKSILTKVYSSIQSLYEGKTDDEINSLMKLLEVFFTHITTDKLFLSNDEKYMLIVDVLSNNALKQSMEYLDENIIVTTVHSAKGLEWDYVIMPDMERNSFPNYMSLCSSCSELSNNSTCKACCLDDKTKSLDKYIEVLSLFYVAVTRARKQVFFSGSLESINDVRYPNTKYSCLLSLPGIKLIQDTILSID